MLRDLRHAVRVLLHAKGWTLVVILSLALGIGANTAIFSAVNGLLLLKLPVRDPDSLVRLRHGGRNDMVTNSGDYGYSAGEDVRATFSYPMYQQLRDDNQTMSDLLGCAPLGRLNVAIDGQADVATGLIATGNYFQMLGVSAGLGRTIVPEDDRPGAPPVAVISDLYWRRRFGGDAHAVGKVLLVNNLPVTIVGVLPLGFSGVQQVGGEDRDLTLPLALDAQLGTGQAPGDPPRTGQPTSWWLEIMGRLKPGVTPAQVDANLGIVFQHTARAGLDSYLTSLSEAERSRSYNQERAAIPRLLVDSGSRGVYDVSTTDIRAATILSAVVVLVLLIVCANVANLLLSRAIVRQKEMSIRLSLGATRARLVRQLLTESLLLAMVGGGLGILVARWGQPFLPGALARPTPIDWHLLAFVFGITAATGVVFGIAPALRTTGGGVGSALKETSRSVVGSRSRLSRVLLVVQVAISLVLLVGAGLFLQTLANLRSVNVGFNPERLALFTVNPRLNQYDHPRMMTLYAQMLDRLKTVPGVQAVSLSNLALLSGGENTTSMYVEGQTYAKDSKHDINRLVISPEFFDTMGMSLAAGRAFTARDDEPAPKVAIVNETAARKYFGGRSPIGQRFGSNLTNNTQIEIVGMLRDVKYNSLRDPAPPTFYVPYLQSLPASATFEVRTAGEPTAAVTGLREAVRQVDPNLPLFNVTTQSEQIERRFSQEKIFAQAYSLFGGLALLLASVGLFGLMSYSVARRTNELGIRMALGAQPGSVLRLVMSDSLKLVAVGVVIGLALALAVGRFVTTLLFGLAPTDLGTMIAATAALVLVSAMAGYLPARRASRVDPLVALRYE